MAAYDFTLNPYAGCGFGCSYCYAAFFARDQARVDDWGRWVEVKQNALQRLRSMRTPLAGKTIYMSSVTDPYQPIERRLGLVRDLLAELAKLGARLVVQTRSPLVTRDIELLKRFDAVRVNMTVTTDSDAVRKAFEPHWPGNRPRLAAIAAVHAAGIRTSITMTPLLPVADPPRFAADLVDTGVRRFVVQPMHAERGRFIAGTREPALALVDRMGWTPDRYRQTVEILRGCGTGATACALALIGSALAAGDRPGPDRMVVEGIDSSPFMVETATAIFAELGRTLPGSRVTASFREASWTDVARDAMPTIVHGGYLLDHSDHLHTDEIAQRLLLLGDLLEVVAVHLTATAGKRSQLREIERLLAIEGWSAESTAPLPFVAGNRMGRCHAVRTRGYESRTRTADAALWQQPPRWHGPLPASLLLRRPPGRAGQALFSDPRGHRLYDERQAEAAEPDQRLTVITGAAGSGKSIVLAERVARSVARSPRADPPPCVLVTAFNKGVVDYLADAIEQSLRALGTTPAHRAEEPGHHELETAGGATIALLNRDKLAHRVFGIKARPGLLRWGDEIERRRRELDETARSVPARFDAAYLEDELERVIYGQRCFSAEAYRDTDRFGRGDRLPNATKDIIWRLLMAPPVDSFVGQRIQAFRRYESAVDEGSRLTLARPWTHVFVDECQDFTATDLQLLARVPPSPHRLCIAGDASQSVHLGRSYRRPGIAGAQWKRHQLRGSYRLPLRVCDALRPLAEQIRTSHLAAHLEEELDSVLLESRKSAVPGFRPVVVAGETVGATAANVFAAYLRRDADRDVLLADCGDLTRTCVTAAAPDVRYVAGRMEKHKGLEWPTVVVSNERSGCRDTSETASERLFTAMTRTTRLLVVVVWQDGDRALGAMLAGLGAARVTFWDRRAHAAFACLSERAEARP